MHPLERRMRRAVAVATCILMGLTPLARAQPVAPAEEVARGHYTLGRALYDAGHFDDAAREFLAAYEIAPRAQLLYNLYLAYRDGSHMVEAADALSRYVATLADGPTKVQLSARLTAMRQMLASRSQTEGDEVETTDAGVTVEPEQVAEPAPAPPQTSALPAVEPQAPPAAAPIAGEATEPRPRTDSRSHGPWTVVGAGAGLVLAGALVGGFALKAQSDLESICPDREACTPGNWRPTRDRGRRLAVAADALWMSGAALGVTGLLWVLLRRSADRDGVTASCTSRGCVLGVRGRF